MANYIILIDNGHGSDTPGKCSPMLEDGSRYMEYKHARLLAARICSELKARGYNAELLTPETTDTSLAKRVSRANILAAKYGKSNTLVVSIHSDAAGCGGWMNGRGWSVYTSPGKTKSDTLATCIWNAMEKSLAAHGYPQTFTAEDTARKSRPMRSDFTDGDCDYEAKLYILTKTSCLAVLTENLYHDNRKDVAFLTSPQGIEAIVQGHVEGIAEYVGKYIG